MRTWVLCEPSGEKLAEVTTKGEAEKLADLLIKSNNVGNNPMTIESRPYIDQPDLRFEFGLEEIAGYIAWRLSELEAAPENHSPHKQVRREQEERKLPLQALQAKLNQALSESCSPTLTWSDVVLDQSGFMLADMLEYEFGTASCPFCQNIYYASELLVYDVSAYNISGRLVTCPKDHTLLQTRERIGEAQEPWPPPARTLRPRRRRP